jgi:hypothetical protein
MMPPGGWENTDRLAMELGDPKTGVSIRASDAQPHPIQF